MCTCLHGTENLPELLSSFTVTSVYVTPTATEEERRGDEGGEPGAEMSQQLDGDALKSP